MENIREFGVCGYKNPDKPGYSEKLHWLKCQYKQGLKIKILYSEKDGTQGMIEYIPGEYCWRPVQAEGYMFIHCLFVGFRKQYNKKGYGSKMIQDCIADAKSQNMKGVAVVTRKGSFMAKNDIFIINGFQIVDKIKPDFELLVYNFYKNESNPEFKKNIAKNLKQYSDGLYIIRADQCPYTVKNVNEICETAEKIFNITPKVINLKNHKQAQNNPCPFGTFGIIFHSKIIAHHPISSKRFSNIINKII